jgi:hypothetical protein
MRVGIRGDRQEQTNNDNNSDSDNSDDEEGGWNAKEQSINCRLFKQKPCMLRESSLSSNHIIDGYISNEGTEAG